MIVKKYKADTETAAILAAKEDLGPEAVVLNVKTMKQRGFAKFFKHDYVEITAALEEKEFEQKERKTFLELNKNVQLNFEKMFIAKDKKIQLTEQYEIQMLYQT